MDARNFLVLSLDEPLAVDLAWQVYREGHGVRYYVASESEGDVADGLVPKTDDWRAELEWADVVVFDDIWDGDDLGTGAIAEELRADGHAVVGGTATTDELENDRGFAMEVLEEHGVAVLPHREFHDFEDGIEFVRENPAPYVVKPLGEVQNVKRLVYVGRRNDGGDVVDVLRAYERAWGHRMKGFQLQRRAEGVEVAVCGFFNGERFVEPVNVNFEHKRLFPGDVGPSTGEMGTSMFWTNRVALFERTLGRLEGFLADEGYVGSIDLNCIVNETGVYPLEFTPRFGYPTIALQADGIRTPMGTVLFELAHGRDPEMEVHRGYQVAVRVVVPPFPFDDPETFEENSKNAAVLYEADDGSVRTPRADDGVHVEDVKRVPRDAEPGEGPAQPSPEADGQWRVAGTSGVVLVVAGKGETMAAAQRQAYERVRRVRIPNAYYRDDVGERWIAGDGDRLQAWGHLRGA